MVKTQLRKASPEKKLTYEGKAPAVLHSDHEILMTNLDKEKNSHVRVDIVRSSYIATEEYRKGYSLIKWS